MTKYKSCPSQVCSGWLMDVLFDAHAGYLDIIWGPGQWATLPDTEQLSRKERKFWQMFVVTSFNCWSDLTRPARPLHHLPTTRLRALTRDNREILLHLFCIRRLKFFSQEIWSFELNTNNTSTLATACPGSENVPLKEIYTYFLSKDTVNYVSFGKSLDLVNIAGPGHFPSLSCKVLTDHFIITLIK